MRYLSRFTVLITVFFIFSGFFLSQNAVGQDEESVYFSKRVVDSNGDQISKSFSEISFTAYLNGETDSLLIETAPRWDGGESNWDKSNSIVGVELQNFTHFAAGDTVYLRFTDMSGNRRGSISQHIGSIPWSDPNPFANISIQDTTFPDRPKNVSVSANDENHQTISWDAKSDLTYRVYRKNRNDFIFNGDQRNLYTLVASGITKDNYTDTDTKQNGEYAYIVYAVDSQGRWSSHSNVAAFNKGNKFLQSSVYLQRRVADSNGDLLDETIDEISVTAYVNGERDSVLTEYAPRWNGSGSNWDRTNSMIGIEFQNFTHFAAGDTAYLRFANLKMEEKGTIVQPVDTIPWSDPNFFQRLKLQSANLPQRPQNLKLTLNASNERQLTWDAKSGLSYHVYRRNRRDTVFNGEARMLYTRIASNVSGGSYTDAQAAADQRYAYLVYAEDSDGTWSAHSKEVFRKQQLTGLQVTGTTPKNVTLQWDAFDPVITELAGYNIYRRQEGETYGNSPVAYSSKDTVYTDTRLSANTTYYYKVLPRNVDLEERGKVDEVKVTTKSSSNNYMTYANLKVGVVIYSYGPSIRGGDYKMTDNEIEDIKFLMRKVKEYYWRNTKMQLNLDYNFIVFEKYKVLPDKSGASTRKTGEHLEEDLGVMNTQYDMIFRITPSVGGFWSWGATDMLGLPGPERRTGFSQVRWPYRGFTIGGFENYPLEFPEIDYQKVGNNLIWTATHENQHTIDGIYNHNGHSEMGHGDFPQLYATTKISNPNIGCCYPGFPEHYSKRYGRRFSFQSTMMRDFRAYKDLKSNWGDMIQTLDKDGDNMPDNDPRVAFDEQSFGSSSQSADTDDDGYTDKQEAVNGIFKYSASDPRGKDTDGDGKVDGKDEHPRYPVDTRVKTTAKGFNPTVDGDIGEWPEYAMVNDTVTKVEDNRPFAPKTYMAYNSDSLYVAMDLPVHAEPLIRWDFDANGRWYGAGNTVMDIDPENGSFSELRTWVANETARNLDEEINDKKDGVGNGLWDTNPQLISELGGRIMTENSVKLNVKATNPGYHIEIAIPRTEKANLMLNQGEEIGFHVDFSNVFDDGTGATMFDWWSYMYVDLTGLKATDIESDDQIVNKFRLKQNYPNPFNPSTKIQYSLPKSQRVKLTVYNVLGRKVATLVNGKKQAGRHEITFDASNLSSGVYIYRLQTNTKSRTRKMMLLK